MVVSIVSPRLGARDAGHISIEFTTFFNGPGGNRRPQPGETSLNWHPAHSYHSRRLLDFAAAASRSHLNENPRRLLMKKIQALTALCLIVITAAASAQNPAPAAPPSAEEQIAASILAAPEEMRAGAAVLGYDAQGKLVTLRKGSNELICLADDPKDNRFSVACYHKDLEPYMARGRELNAQGITGGDRNAQHRWKEIEEGKLKMPKQPTMLYVLSGKGFDAASGKVVDGSLRWVIYVPFATAESLGLSAKPKRGEPWLMDAGTAGAHIMITPPAK